MKILSNFCFEFFNAPLVYAIEEFDGVKQAHRHLVSFDFPLVMFLRLLVVMQLLHLGVESDPPAGPLTQFLVPGSIKTVMRGVK